jgi:hypothetical protein
MPACSSQAATGSAGLLNVQGNLVQTAAGTLEADLLGTSVAQQDRLQVSGTIALGGDLVITPANGVVLGAQDRYTVLSCTADACLSGSFASIDTNGLTATATTFSNALSFATGTFPAPGFRRYRASGTSHPTGPAT